MRITRITPNAPGLGPGAFLCWRLNGCLASSAEVVATASAEQEHQHHNQNDHSKAHTSILSKLGSSRTETPYFPSTVLICPTFSWSFPAACSSLPSSSWYLPATLSFMPDFIPVLL